MRTPLVLKKKMTIFFGFWKSNFDDNFWFSKAKLSIKMSKKDVSNIKTNDNVSGFERIKFNDFLRSLSQYFLRNKGVMIYSCKYYISVMKWQAKKNQKNQ